MGREEGVVGQEVQVTKGLTSVFLFAFHHFRAFAHY